MSYNGYGYGHGPLPPYSPGQAPPAYSNPPAYSAVGTPAPQAQAQNGVIPATTGYAYNQVHQPQQAQVQHPYAQQPAYIQPQAQYAAPPRAAYAYGQAQYVPYYFFPAFAPRPVGQIPVPGPGTHGVTAANLAQVPSVSGWSYPPGPGAEYNYSGGRQQQGGNTAPRW